MSFVVALLLIIGVADLDAQVRPVDPPRRCTRAGVASVPVDTSLDLTAGPQATTLLRALLRTGPLYPVEQRNARIPGEVRVSYTIDTTGRVVRGTAEVVAETHRNFGQSVCEFLRRARFEPIVVDGRKLTVRVIHSRFMFSTRG